MGVILGKLNRLEEAIQTYQNAIDVDTKKELCSIIQINLSTTYRKLKDYDSALKEAEKAINNAQYSKEISEKHTISQAYICAAVVYINQTIDLGSMDFSKAEEELRKAKEICPQNQQIEEWFSFIEKTKRYGYMITGEDTIFPGIKTVKKYVPGEG